jgi:cytidylate kinase
MTTPIITIDGTAASGKGTLAKLLAQKLGFAHMDTGVLYRLVAVRMIENGCDASDEQAAVEFAQVLRRTYSPRDGAHPELRTDAVSLMTSKTSAYAAVRAEMLGLQRDFAENPPSLPDGTPAKGAVLDGRDIGTVVCPDAPAKFFVTASLEVRAERRFKELHGNGFPETFEHVLTEMRERDARDAARATAPMKAAADAVVLDTSVLNIEQMVAAALSHIKEKIAL